MPTTKCALINGPNLNLLGQREVEIYGKDTLASIINELRHHAQHHAIELVDFQSNHEGAIIDFIHQIYAQTQPAWLGAIVNLAAYTHTSIAIYDALKLLPMPIIEVHLSNIAQREPFRNYSYVARLAQGMISGMGKWGYRAALDYLIAHRSQ